MTDHNLHSSDKGDVDSDPQTKFTDPDRVKEIGIEEFQPKGTLTITLLYFVVIILMWLFMYFVEFAGNEPSILN